MNHRCCCRFPLVGRSINAYKTVGETDSPTRNQHLILQGNMPAIIQYHSSHYHLLIGVYGPWLLSVISKELCLSALYIANELPQSRCVCLQGQMHLALCPRTSNSRWHYKLSTEGGECTVI